MAWPSVAPSGHRPDNINGSDSGLVFTPDGCLLTNSRVVRGAKVVIVAFADGAEYRARPIGDAGHAGARGVGYGDWRTAQKEAT